MNQGFGFEFIVNFSMETFQIKPPLSFAALVELSIERFDLVKISEFCVDEEEISITNDSDYLKLLDWAENSDLKEIELIIKSKDPKKKRIKSLRKISNSFKPVNTVDINESEEDDGTINGNFYN